LSLIIIQDEPRKYHFDTKDQQRVDIEHKNDDFIYLTLYKWGNEASLQIVLDTVPVHNHTFIGNVIEVENPDFLLRVYPIDTRTTGDLYGDSDDVVQCHDGGARFELVLKKKRPAMSNSIVFPIISKNLRFAYQPFLSQQEINEGIIRPLNVEGSYAVYHLSKKNNQYMTGKAFHLFRPIAEDSLGVKVWCAITVDSAINPTSLTITIPQQFLDDATYPITIDPDFGEQAIGGSWFIVAYDTTATRGGSAWTMPGGGPFTANYIRAYVQSGAGDVAVDCKAFINQKDSGGAGTHGQIATKENLACVPAAHWEEFTLSGEALTSTIVYILNIIGNDADTGSKDNYQLAFDVDGATAVASYAENQTYAAPENPWVDNPEPTTRDYSIYCNYSAAAAGWTGTITGVTDPAAIMGVDVEDIDEVKGVVSS